MTTPTRNQVLESNKRVRDGLDPKRQLDCGETAFRVPDKDFMALRALFPALASEDKDEQFRAWKRFAVSPFSEPYRVVRSASQVRRSDKRIQVR